MKWQYFVVAILVVGYAMLAVGAPPVAVAAGIGFAALLNLKQLAALKPRQPKATKSPATSASGAVNP